MAQAPPEAPSEWAFLWREPAPRMLVEALKWYGTREISGPKNSPRIMGWARRVGGWVASYYTSDEIPWCGLFIGYVAAESGKPFSQNMLAARKWLEWGTPVDAPMLGDVLVFSRGAGGHVGLYVGESADGETFAVLGGNQGNRVSIAHIERKRLLGARHHYAVGQPANCRRIFYDRAGDEAVSVNEA